MLAALLPGFVSLCVKLRIVISSTFLPPLFVTNLPLAVPVIFSSFLEIIHPRTDNKLHQEVKKNPFISSSKLRQMLGETCQQVSARTIRRRLTTEFFTMGKKTSKKSLSEQSPDEEEILLSQKYLSWSKEQWEVFFSDETAVMQFETMHTTARRPSREQNNPKYTEPTVKHPPKLMVLGCFGSQGREGLWFMPPNITINAEVCLSVLDSKLEQFMAIGSYNVFQQDGAPCHTARKVKQWSGLGILQI